MTAFAQSPARPRAEPRSPASASRAELLPWLAVMVFGLQGLRTQTDPDLWWHLRTGQWIVLHHRIPTVDHWSFASTKPWVAHEWLAQVFLYMAYRSGGYHGVLLLRAAMLAAIAFVVVRECRRRGNWLHATIAALFGLATVEPGAAARPQLASFLLMALFGPVLMRAVVRRRAPVSLIPLIWLWANLHGLWTFALVVYLAVVVGLAIHLRGRERRTLTGFLGVGVGMVVAVGLTPNGPKLLLSPLAVHGVTKFVTEWQAPHITSLPTIAGLVLLAVVVIGWARNVRQVPAYELAYVFVAAGLTLAYVRTGPLAGVLLAPIAAGALARLFHEPVTALRFARGSRRAAVLAGVVTLALGALILDRLPAIAAPAPLAASRVIDDLPGRQRVLTEPELGNWMLWTARDSSPAFDGRYEIFGPSYIGRYIDMLNMRGNWRGFVTASRAGAAWLHVDIPLVAGLREQLHWTVAWTDGKTVILVRPPAGPVTPTRR
ncbi:MAG: hypothetical protein M3042_09350 [Actinomycetota bacterium]|nr:hypothetical protein [Actinomycetota bacterium]